MGEAQESCSLIATLQGQTESSSRKTATWGINGIQPRRSTINVDEMKNAEKEILRLVQRGSFLSEINALQNAK